MIYKKIIVEKFFDFFENSSPPLFLGGIDFSVDPIYLQIFDFISPNIILQQNCFNFKK